MKQEAKASSFISKFDAILRNRNFQAVIRLDECKAKIYVLDKERLETEILPYYYRHNKFTSFIRQLNLYGFKKVKNATVLTFTHPHLQNRLTFLSIVAKKKLPRQPPSDSPDAQPQTPSAPPSAAPPPAAHPSLPLQHPPALPLPPASALQLDREEGSSASQWWGGGRWDGCGLPMVTYLMPIPGLYPGAGIINYFRSFQG